VIRIHIHSCASSHFDVVYDIDASGFRIDPLAGKTGSRVAVLGDSFTFGLGVANGETFVSRLNAGSDDGRHYLNLGVPGYSTDQELLLLKKTGNALKPDIVLLVVYLANDLFDNNRSFPCRRTLRTHISGSTHTGSWCWKIHRCRSQHRPGG